MTPDSELLTTFARTNSEEAFAEIVRRHVNLVYYAALRQVNGDEHRAKDVAQSVFTDLAGKAASLARRESLTGWLYTSAHFAAGKIIRSETRRRDREEKFMREPTNEPAAGGVSGDDWEQLRPALDEAMHELKEADREAVLLRYFENRPFAEVGTRLGLNENAARMRVERAVEKLRAVFTKRGVATTSAFAATISTHAVGLAPVSLAPALTTVAVAGAGTQTLTLLKLMTMTKLKLAASAICVAGAAAALVVQHQALDKLRGEKDALQQQVTQLKADADKAANSVTAASTTKLTDDQFDELLKLRGEVGLLRQQTGELEKVRKENTETAKQLKTAEQKAAALVSAVAQFSAHEAMTVNALKQVGLAFHVYANNHGDQCATNWEQMSNELGSAYPSYTISGIELGSFEFMNVGALDWNHSADMVAFRERLARQSPNGTWGRIYGLLDGSVQTARSNDGDFTAWEKVNTYTPPAH